MKHYVLSAAVNLAVDNYVKNLRRAFPSTPWAGVQHYAKRAWFAADEPGVPWDQVESHLMDAWIGDADTTPILVPAIPDRSRIGPRQKSHLSDGPCTADAAKNSSHHDAVTGAEYEEWSVGRRFHQDQTKAGREPFRDARLDYGSHG